MRLFLTAFLCLSAFAFAQNFTPGTGTVTAEKLTIRARPGLHFESLGMFHKGDRLDVLGSKGEWYEVALKGDFTGWVPADALDANGQVTAASCPLYCGPGVVFTVFHRVKRGTILTEMTGRKAVNWRQVRVPEGCTAWVSAAYVQLDVPEKKDDAVVKSENGNAAVPAVAIASDAVEKQPANEVKTDKSDADEAQKLMLEQEKALAAKMRDEAARKLEEEQKKVEEARIANEQRLAEEKKKAEEVKKAADLEAAKVAAEKARLAEIEEQRKQAEEKAREEEMKYALAEENAKKAAEKAAEASRLAAEKAVEEEAKRAKLEEQRKLAEQKLMEEDARRMKLEEQAKVAAEKAAEAEKILKEAQAKNAELTAQAENLALAAKEAAEAKEAEEKAAAEAKAAEAKAAEEKAAQAKAEEEARIAAEKAAKEKADAEMGFVNYSGYIYSLGKNASQSASHVLCFLDRNGRARPICYLNSRHFSLNGWGNAKVSVRGKITKPKDWNFAIMDVTSVVRDRE